MTGVRKFKPENRLAKALGDPGGLLFSQALKSASANVAQVRPAHLVALDAKLTALRELAHAPRAPAFYRLAQDVMADAGSVGLPHLSRAAQSLCDLLASPVPDARLQRSVMVHVDALTPLRAEEGAPAQREAILAALAQLSGAKA